MEKPFKPEKYKLPKQIQEEIENWIVITTK